MVSRLREYFDVRSGEGLPVLLAFLYIAVVVASFLLAKPIRNSLFLKQYGPYSLVYVYAAVPLALSAFVPVYTRISARFGSRAVMVWTLLFFSGNVLLLWYAFRYYMYEGMLAGLTTGPGGIPPVSAVPPTRLAWLLPGIFYVWVNCFGVIAPVQAWSFANSLFDTRQAKRLFGLIGAGASLGAIGGGLLARFLVGPVGGTVNMMLVLAALILSAAAIVTFANMRIHRRGLARRGPPASQPFLDSLRQIRASPYLRLMAALVFLVAIATQWTNFQLSLVADLRFGRNADGLTRFFGTFNFTLGTVAFLLQLLLTGPALRRFGVAATILILPVLLTAGNVAILLVPSFMPVLFTNAADQAFRFSVDKATYELLYLPLPTGLRGPLKNAIDIMVNRVADGVGAVLLGFATRGFVAPGLGLGLRGTALINLAVLGIWIAVAWRLRVEYVRTIQASIHKYRVDSEQTVGSSARSTTAEMRISLSATDPADVRYALGLIEAQHARHWQSSVRALLVHEEADIRRRALAMLSAARDRTIAPRVSKMLRDPDLGVRTEALLYLSREMGIDPLHQLEELGDFEDFSIRAGMAAFLASPGRTQNLDAARLILQAMVKADGPKGARERVEAARLFALVPDAFTDLLEPLIDDPDTDVARQAIRTAKSLPTGRLRPALVGALARPDLVEEAAAALAHHGEPAIPEIERRLRDPETPLEVKRELPAVLVRIGTPYAARVLVDSLLQADVTLRFRIISSLNQLQNVHHDVRADHKVVEVLLAAEIAGHYRSYQVLGALGAGLRKDDDIITRLRQSMEQELERIFRLMALLHPAAALHDAYVGVRSSSTAVRANALEFLENTLPPDLCQVLLPLLDGHVTDEQRRTLADRYVGTPLETAEQAVGTLLSSEDPWLRSCGVHAVGTLQLHGLEQEVRKLENAGDTALRESVQATLERLSAETESASELAVDVSVNVGAG